MMPDIQNYHAKLSSADRAICERLAGEITRGLRGAEAKVWHAHPVWFLEGNPIVVNDHCYGCTAGQGSSCGGALA